MSDEESGKAIIREGWMLYIEQLLYMLASGYMLYCLMPVSLDDTTSGGVQVFYILFLLPFSILFFFRSLYPLKGLLPGYEAFIVVTAVALLLSAWLAFLAMFVPERFMPAALFSALITLSTLVTPGLYILVSLLTLYLKATISS